MKTTRQISLFLTMCVLFILSGCDDKEKWIEEYPFQKSFTRVFYLPSMKGDNTGAMTNYGTFIRVVDNIGERQPGHTTLGFQRTDTIWYDWKDKNFRNLAEALGDNGYDDRVFFLGDGHSVIGEKVLGIKLLCLRDFDDNHKAMSCLNDIAEMEWYSPQQYISAKYRWTDSNIGNGWDDSNWYKDFPEEQENMKYHGDLDDASIFPISMFGEYFRIRFKSEPKEKGDYRIRIQMELESGVQTSEFVQKW